MTGTVATTGSKLNGRSEPAVIRPLAAGMAFGALAGAVIFWVAVQWPQYNPLGAWLGAADGASEVLPGVETWPICSAMGSLAADVDWAPLDPDFAAGKTALAAEDWHAAIASLTLAALREPNNADIQNYIGYAYRRLRQLEPAFVHYWRAVALNPRHRSARQHLGEAFLLGGDIQKAEEQLAALERICLVPCDEYVDLNRAIEARRAAAVR